MAEPLAPLSELPFFAANRKGLRHGAKVTKKENQMKSEKKFLVTGPTGLEPRGLLRDRQAF